MKRTTDTVTLAKQGKTTYTIVYEFSGDLLLEPAVRDLAATPVGQERGVSLRV